MSCFIYHKQWFWKRVRLLLCPLPAAPPDSGVTACGLRFPSLQTPPGGNRAELCRPFSLRFIPYAALQGEKSQSHIPLECCRAHQKSCWEKRQRPAQLQARGSSERSPCAPGRKVQFGKLSRQLNNSKHTHIAGIYLVTSTSRTEINGRCAAVGSRELSAPGWQLPMSAGQRHWFGRHRRASDTG